MVLCTCGVDDPLIVYVVCVSTDEIIGAAEEAADGDEDGLLGVERGKYLRDLSVGEVI